MDELLVIFVESLVMVILVNSVPNVVAGLIPGGGGAALGSAAMSGATNMAGGDMPSFGGSSSDTGESWGVVPLAAITRARVIRHLPRQQVFPERAVPALVAGLVGQLL